MRVEHTVYHQPVAAPFMGARTEVERITNYRDDRRQATLLQFCRQLRLESTDAEQLLWRILRNRQVAGTKFRRQHQFADYIIDFYCKEHNLAIEVDGGQHFDDNQADKDAKRTSYLESRGIRVLRFDNLQVLQETEGVLEAIWQVLTKGPSP